MPIVTVQKVAIRLICNLKSKEHTSLYFKQLNILKFTDLVEFKIIMLMFKAGKNSLPDNLQCLFQNKVDRVYVTRKSCNFIVKYSKTKIKSNCLSIIGVKSWNQLEENLKSCKSLVKFKMMFKSLYLS